MSAFLKTLIGDVWNLSVVAVILLAEAALIFSGNREAAAFAVPPLTLAGIIWLARR